MPNYQPGCCAAVILGCPLYAVAIKIHIARLSQYTMGLTQQLFRDFKSFCNVPRLFLKGGIRTVKGANNTVKQRFYNAGQIKFFIWRYC